MRHPRDPAAPHFAAAAFGRLLALGLLDDDEATAALREIAARAPKVDRSGLQARLMHVLADSRGEWSLRRDQAIARVHRAVAPLLTTWASAAAVQRAAAAAGGDDLEKGEAVAIAAGLAAVKLRHSA